MFIEPETAGPALRQEGNVYRTRDGRVRPPSGGPCFLEQLIFLQLCTDMALLTEGGPSRLGFYKHCPPDGGGRVSNRFL